MKGSTVAVPTATAMVDALHRSALFDAGSQEAVQRTLRLAAAALRAPVAILSIGDGSRQVLRGVSLPGAAGIPTEASAYAELMRASHGRASFVDGAARTGGTGPGEAGIACTFAATPLLLSGGQGVIGTLAVADVAGREGSIPPGCLQELASALAEQLQLRAENGALRQKQANLELQKQVFSQIAEGAPLNCILTSLASFIEHQSEGTLCVIHLLGADGKLHVEAGPTMPETLLALIDDTSASMDGGVAARAVQSGEPVLVRDLGGSRDAASRAMVEQGIRAAWSFPIHSNGVVSGAIDVYRMHAGDPADEDLHLVSVATSAARIAVDRRRAEADLRASEIYHRALIENSSEFILVLDAGGAARYVSRRFAQAVGRAPEEVCGLKDVVAREDLGLLEDLMAGLARGSEREFELRIVSADGTIRHILGTGTNLLGNAAVRGLVINARDVTQQKRAIAALSDSEERYRLVARASSDLIWDLDMVDGSVMWPARDEHRFGYEYADLPRTQSSWSALVHPDDLARVKDGLSAVLRRQGEETWTDEYRFRQRDGSYATVLDRGFIVRDDKGEPIRMIGSMMDLTSRRMLEEQLRQAQRMEAIGRLAGGVAHDFNNLLTVIEGFTAMLIDELGTDGERGLALEEIQKASSRAATLTRQLLAFSRRQVLQPRLLDVNQVVHGVGGMLRRLIPADIVLETKLGAGEMLVHADVGQLEQVLLNLVINARESIVQGGVITIRTDRTSSAAGAGDAEPAELVRLSVTDDGCGMDPDVVAHIFEPFFTTKESGTGLGLATVYGIVEQSGGRIEVQSTPGAGSRFDVYLPVRMPATTAVAAADAPQAVATHGSETILLVEDDPAVRGLTVRLLARQGYQVFAADDGPTALGMLTDGAVEPDLLLTDVVLPHMSGPVVAERVLALKPDTALVFMSGYTDELLGQHGVLSAEVAFLQKPFQKGSLLGLVRDQLDARAASNAAARHRNRRVPVCS